MEQDNKERLIFYKRITPYYTQEKVTETVKVDTDNTILSTHAQEPVITQIYATETETGYTKVEKIEYDAVSGISATTVTRIVNIPDDITKDCKLTMQDLDDNFLTLKERRSHATTVSRRPLLTRAPNTPASLRRLTAIS